MATKMKKTLSLALALIMVLGMLPLTAFAAEKTPSGVGTTWVDVAHGNSGIGDGNHINSNETDGVTTEKTATRTGNENEFAIQLKVTTKENLAELQVAPDAAVVLVVDTSGSMDDSVGKDASGNKTTRMESVQNILATDEKCFLNEYAKVDGAENVRRMVSIVNFAGGAAAQTFGGSYWANVADATGLESAKGVINSFTADGGTNIEGGLQLAYNLLTDETLGAAVKDIPNRYVILLTDGVPTYHLDGTNSTIAASFTGVKGGSSKAELEDYCDIPAIAAKIKDAAEGNAKLQAVAYGNVSSETLYKETVTHQCNKSQGHTHTSIDIKNKGYSDGNGPLKDYFYGPYTGKTQTGTSVTVKKWMTDVVGIDPVYTPANAGKLAEDFATIVENIQTLAQAWIVTDPMGEYVEYVPDSADKPAPLVGVEDGTLTWYMMKEKQPTVDADGNYTYTLTYKVKLLNEKEGFTEGEGNLHPTNGQTTLKYMVKTNDGTGDALSDLKSIDFYVPTVWGTVPMVPYTIEYYKQDKDTNQYKRVDNNTRTANAKLYSLVKIADADSNYLTKYQDSGYSFNHGDTQITLTSTTQNVMKLYYNPIPATVTVNHYVLTKTISDENPTGTYGKPVLQSTVSYPEEGQHLYEKDSFTAGKLSLTPYTGSDHVSDNAKIDSLQAANTLNFYYEQETGTRTPVPYAAHYFIRTNEWTLNTTTGKYEKTEGQYAEQTQLAATGSGWHNDSYTAPDQKGEYTEAKVESSSNTRIITLNKGGNNTIKVYYDKDGTEPEKAALKINHIYEEQRVNGLFTYETIVTYNDEVHVGETWTAEKKLTAHEHSDWQCQTTDAELSKTMIAGSNEINVKYHRDARQPVTVQVEHIYNIYKWELNAETGKMVEVLDSAQSKTEKENLTGTFYVGGSATASSQPLYGTTAAETNQLTLENLKAEGNLITLNYAYHPSKEGLTDATLKVTHVYNTYTSFVDEAGTVHTNALTTETVDVTEDDFSDYHPGEWVEVPLAPKEGYEQVSPNIKGTEPIKHTFVGESDTLTITYQRFVDELIEKKTTLMVKPVYVTYTMSVNQETGEVEREETVRDDSTAATKITPVYVGQKYTVSSDTLSNLANGFTLDDALTPGNTYTDVPLAGDDTITLYYSKQIEKMTPATVVVRNHYLYEVTTSVGGVLKITKTVDEMISGAEISGLYQWMFFTTTGKGTGAEGYAADPNHELPAEKIQLVAGVNYVDFYWYGHKDETVPASIQVIHDYTIYDYDGTVISHFTKNGNDAQSPNIVTGYYEGGNYTASPEYPEGTWSWANITTVDGAEKRDGETSEIVKATLAAGLNVITIHYAQHQDTRVPVQVQVIHSYYLLDENVSGGLISEGEYTTTANTVAKGAYVGANYVAAQRLTNGEGKNVKTYNADVANVYEKVLTATVTDNVIRLKYTREYGEGEGFAVNGTKTYEGLNSDQYPVTTVSLSNSEHQYSATVNNADGHFSFTNVVPGVYDISESAAVSGYTYAAKYELTANSAPLDITDNPQITVVAATEYLLEITNTYTSNPTPPPTPGTTYYGVTVEYVDEAGKELSAAHTERHYEGFSYDVTDKTTLEIADYTIKSVTGDALTGRLNGDKVITVVYAPVTVIPDEKVPEGGEPGEITLPDVEPPKTDLPEELEDGAVPLDAAPKTGDTTALWVTLMTVSGFGLAALAIFKGKKKEEESAE